MTNRSDTPRIRLSNLLICQDSDKDIDINIHYDFIALHRIATLLQYYTCIQKHWHKPQRDNQAHFVLFPII